MCLVLALTAPYSRSQDLTFPSSLVYKVHVTVSMLGRHWVGRKKERGHVERAKANWMHWVFSDTRSAVDQREKTDNIKVWHCERAF